MAMENPWASLPSEPPYVLPMDRDGVAAHERRLARLNPERRKVRQLHTELLPTPFVGDPLAPVVLLNLNPGYSDRDVGDYAEPPFHNAAVDNLTHAVSGLPFFPVDPQFSQTSSYDWWAARLRQIMETTGLDNVARRLFCVQAFPYHSQEFDPWLWEPARLYELFPSQSYTAHLLSDAAERDAMIIGLRSGKDARNYWANTMPGLDRVRWLRTRTGGAPRSPYLTENLLGSEGWQELRRRLEE